jgi:FKBP-type peptidyl-prolyl cis-trans isomerase 2
MAVPGVERQLLEMKPGEEREFEVGQDEAFGRREPRLIRIISHHRFISQKINPVPGTFVNIDGRHARIQSVSGGRVRVDFNNPLAGKDLRYRLRLVRRITKPQERAQALLDHYGLKAQAAFREGTLTIQTDENLPDQLRQLLDSQLTRWIKEIKKVDYVTKERPGKTGEEKSADGAKGEKPV